MWLLGRPGVPSDLLQVSGGPIKGPTRRYGKSLRHTYYPHMFHSVSGVLPHLLHPLAVTWRHHRAHAPLPHAIGPHMAPCGCWGSSLNCYTPWRPHHKGHAPLQQGPQARYGASHSLCGFLGSRLICKNALEHRELISDHLLEQQMNFLLNLVHVMLAAAICYSLLPKPSYIILSLPFTELSKHRNS